MSRKRSRFRNRVYRIATQFGERGRAYASAFKRGG